ncbi:MAG: Pyuvate ferredoxin oxidoreductase subunit delta [Promethearchaeota archaeon]|nr:MAG: Pyuvate ferredoxin oxidoreductase subunit delta [Candidatus Lokiarchaeota archaeon]
METKISIVNVNNHKTVQKSIVEAIKLIEPLPFNLKEAKSILIKPNLLIAKEDACTQPSFVEGVINYLFKIGIPSSKIKIGDSPGQFKKNAKEVAEEVGIYEVCENYGIEFVDFEHTAPSKEDIKGSKKIEEHYVAKAVKECDVLINLPRLKTHGEATITGAIKNYWGVIPGGLKAKFHLLGKNPGEFGKVITDNYSWITQNKPNRLIIYDLHRIMEGTMGPVSGSIKNWDLILVGTDELALDIAALEIGDFDGKKFVPHIKDALERNLGVSNLEKVEIKGIPLEKAKKDTPKFNVPNKFMTKLASWITSNIVYKITKKIPVLNKHKCIKCGQCAEICPVEGILFKLNHFPEFSRKECISCLCCAELCPQQAISTKSRGFWGLFRS